MKKTIIAGAAASVALAAMPLVGVFAEDPKVVDTFNVTVNKSCTFGSTTGQTYTASLDMNDIEEFTGKKTTLTVICNGTSGYNVTASFIGLTSGDNTIPYYTTDAPTAGKSVWAAYKNGTPLTSGVNVMENDSNTSATGDTIDITYKVSTADGQAAGTYEGSATYTLHDLTVTD